MKSKSPFSKNTPLNEIEIFQGSTSTYRHPSTVIQPIVGAKIGKKLAETGSEVAVDAINAMPGKEPRPKEEAFTGRVAGYNIKPDTIKSKKLEIKTENISKFMPTPPTPKKSLTQAYADRDMGKYGGMTLEQYKAVAKKDPLYGTSGTKGGLKKMESTVTYIDGKKVLQTPYKQAKNNSLAINMNGSPAKQIDPYEAINPEAVPGAQAQNVLGAQPIVGADLNQARNVDMQAMIDPYKSPGATFKPGEKLKAENIYGQASQRQALMNLGSPMHAHTPTHGKKYKKGDLIDESDFDTFGTGYNVENISDIQEDEKGQFITTLSDSERKVPPIKSRPKSRIIDYPDPKGSVRDTIRPKVGKFFKRS